MYILRSKIKFVAVTDKNTRRIEIKQLSPPLSIYPRWVFRNLNSYFISFIALIIRRWLRNLQFVKKMTTKSILYLYLHYLVNNGKILKPVFKTSPLSSGILEGSLQRKNFETITRVQIFMGIHIILTITLEC